MRPPRVPAGLSVRREEGAGADLARTRPESFASAPAFYRSPAKRSLLTRVWLALTLACLVPIEIRSQETIKADALHQWQLSGKKLSLIDVRSAGEFQIKHIAAAVNIPHGRILEAKLSNRETVVLYCTGEGCPLSHEAGRELAGKGYKKVFVLEGGIAEWEARGYPIVASKPAAHERVVQAGRMSPRELRGRSGKGGELVLDVRPALEFAAGHLPGAVNAPLDELGMRMPELDRAKLIVIYDRSPERSREAGKLLIENGFAVKELAGGIAVWVAMKYPLEM